MNEVDRHKVFHGGRDTLLQLARTSKDAEILRALSNYDSNEILIEIANNSACPVDVLISIGYPTRIVSKNSIKTKSIHLLRNVWSNPRYPIGKILEHTQDYDNTVTELAKELLRSKDMLSELLDE